MTADRPHKIPVVFYRTPAGAEVVRDWLRNLDQADRNAIGQDLMRVQYRWPAGMPLCRSMGDGLWECEAPFRTIGLLVFCSAFGKAQSWCFMASSRRAGRRLTTCSLWHANATANSRRKETDMAHKKKTLRSTANLTTLDVFLKKEGKLEEFEATAIKEVLAWQIAEAMKQQNLSRKRLAERMGTSRSQISRLLDPKDGNVTIATLQRAAKIVGRSLRLELV